MSSQLSEMDRELLGEVSHKDRAEATMAETTGGPGKGGLEDSHGIEFTPLNATAGTLVKVSSNGDELESGNVSSQSYLSSHFHLLDNIFLAPLTIAEHPFFVLEIIYLSVCALPNDLTPSPSCEAATKSFTPAHNSCLFKPLEACKLRERAGSFRAFSKDRELRAFASYSPNIICPDPFRDRESEMFWLCQLNSLISCSLKHFISLCLFMSLHSQRFLADRPRETRIPS